MKKRERILIYITIILLIALFLVFLFKAYSNYSRWKTYYNYFNQEDEKIEQWMTLKMISTRFGISQEQILKEAGVNATRINPRASLNRFCTQYHKDCADLVRKLNLLAGK